MNLKELNTFAIDDVFNELIKCCSSKNWAQELIEKRPFDSIEKLKELAEETWFSLSKEDWLEAFSGHPQIGNVESLKEKYANTSNWAKGEQAGVAVASDETIEELAELNQQYLDKYGYIFIVCATGKSAVEMLDILKSRLSNEKEEELLIAAREQMKITNIRLEKLL